MSTTSTTSTSTTSTTSTSTTIGAVTIENFRSKLQFILQDDSEKIGPTELDLAIDHSVRIYSKDRPLEKIKEDDTANSSKYDFDLPYDWDDRFSAIIGRIEYPVSDDVQTPQYMDDNDWIIYEKANGKVLRFLTIKPSSNYTIRYKYLVPHTVSDTDCTIHENDFDAVCDLAAGICFFALAAKHSQTEEPTIDADVIDYGRKADQYNELAKDSFNRYSEHMGRAGAKSRRSGASISKDLDLGFAWGSGYLTHPPVQH